MLAQKQSFAAPTLFLVHQLAQKVRKVLLAEFKSEGVTLTPEQWSILVQLWKEDGLSPSQLAELTSRDRPSLTRLIDSLKNQGLIKRMYSEEDRRAYCVYLTPEGKKCHEILLPIHDDVMARAMANIKDSELEKMNKLLLLITRNFDEMK